MSNVSRIIRHRVCLHIAEPHNDALSECGRTMANDRRSQIDGRFTRSFPCEGRACTPFGGHCCSALWILVRLMISDIGCTLYVSISRFPTGRRLLHDGFEPSADTHLQHRSLRPSRESDYSSGIDDTAERQAQSTSSCRLQDCWLRHGKTIGTGRGRLETGQCARRVPPVPR